MLLLWSQFSSKICEHEKASPKTTRRELELSHEDEDWKADFFFLDADGHQGGIYVQSHVFLFIITVRTTWSSFRDRSSRLLIHKFRSAFDATYVVVDFNVKSLKLKYSEFKPNSHWHISGCVRLCLGTSVLRATCSVLFFCCCVFVYNTGYQVKWLLLLDYFGSPPTSWKTPPTHVQYQHFSETQLRLAKYPRMYFMPTTAMFEIWDQSHSNFHLETYISISHFDIFRRL